MILAKEKVDKNVSIVVDDYKFQFLDGKSSNYNKEELLKCDISDYKFEDLKNKIVKKIDNKEDKKEQMIRFERQKARENNFIISPIVSEQRGLIRQAEKEREDLIQQEVTKRISELEEAAVKKGFEEGVALGRAEVFRQIRAGAEEKITSLTEMISVVLNNYSEILKKQKLDIFKMVNNLTKWIVLRELQEDGAYLNRLLEKLILEVQSKSNLLIQVNQKDFEKMPDVLKVVQEKLGELTNVRIEIGYDIEVGGIVVESENGIVNASLSAQFENLDKLFKSVGINE